MSILPLLIWIIAACLAVFTGSVGLLMLFTQPKVFTRRAGILACWFWLMLVVELYLSCPFILTLAPAR